MQYYVEEGKLQESFFAFGKVKVVINKYNLSRISGSIQANYQPTGNFPVHVYLWRSLRINAHPCFNKGVAVRSGLGDCTIHCVP
jgi:hypothetical protein